MNIKSILIVAIPALACGVLLGYFGHPAPAIQEQTASPVDKRVKKSKAQTDEAALNRLRLRIQELEKQLAEKTSSESKTPEAEEEVKNPPRSERHGPPSFEDMRAHMEEIKKNDPERYTQMTNHFAQMRQHRLEHAQNRLDILGSVDVTRLNPKQREIHESFQDAIARREELREQMIPENMAKLSEEERKKAWEEMRRVDNQMHNLAQQERDILLNKAARDMGVKGEALKDSVETIKAIFEATQTRGGPGDWGRGPGGQRGPRRR